MTNNFTDNFAVVTPAVVSYIERQILAVLLGVITMTGLLGNSVVILAVILSRKLRRCVTNFFIVSLSVADLVACLSMPWTMVSLLHLGVGWPLPEPFCKMGGFGLIMSVGCSIFTLAVVALNRLHLITMPRPKYQKNYTPVKIALMILVSWLVPITVASVPLVTDFGRLGYSARTASCTRDTSHPRAIALNAFLSLVFFPVPCLVIISSYGRIYFFTRRHTNIITVEHNSNILSDRLRGREPRAHHHAGWRRHVSKRHLQVTRNMFCVVCVFSALVTPYGVALLCPNNDHVLVYAAVLLSFNSCINPLIYSTKHPDFKTVITCILSCRCGDIPGRIRMFPPSVQPLNY